MKIQKEALYIIYMPCIFSMFSYIDNKILSISMMFITAGIFYILICLLEEKLSKWDKLYMKKLEEYDEIKKCYKIN